jgi:hypothetical protein
MQMLTLAAVADRMGTDVAGVHNLIASGDLLAVMRDGHRVVPARFLDGSRPVKHGSAVLRLLLDGGYSPEEALTWMSTEDPSLPGSAFDALHEDRATEVKRRAQSAAF